MKKIQIENSISLAFGAVVYLFFTIWYPFHFHYQEQYQLFLLTSDYFSDFAAIPGGLSDYIGGFITQFYFYTSIGALILAILLVALQLLVRFIAKLISKGHVNLALTFIPSIMYWSLLCNENYLPGGMVALILMVLFIAVSINIKSKTINLIFALASVPILYWMAGGMVFFYVLFQLIILLYSEKKQKTALALFAVQLIVAISLPFIAKAILVQYPLIKFWTGVNIYSFPNTIPFYVIGIALTAILTPFATSYLTTYKKFTKAIVIASWLLIIIGCGILVHTNSDFDKEEVMAYDFYTRMRKWDKIIQMADKKAPTSPLSVSCLNLALAQKGMLADHMFEYYQNGIGGLLPDFKKDFTIPMVTGEIYYHLGFINTAQRYTFEAMEALPLYQKSARTMKRLAETNLINNNIPLARKYLKLLQKTLFYKKWANAVSNALEDPSILMQHPEYGRLMAQKIDNDFFFSENEKDMMLGQLFTADTKNRMAFEYLMAYCLLNKDLNHFMQYLNLGQKLNYKTLPRSYQEGFIYSWKMTPNNTAQPMPGFISNNLVQKADVFLAQANQANGADILKKDYGNTYWYYLLYRN